MMDTTIVEIIRMKRERRAVSFVLMYMYFDKNIFMKQKVTNFSQ